MTTMDGATIWAMCVVAGLGTIALRFSFIGMLSKNVRIPPVALRALALVPAAVLAALVAPALARAGGSIDLLNARFAAGLLAAVVAWRTGNVLATLASGMVVLWAIQAIA